MADALPIYPPWGISGPFPLTAHSWCVPVQWNPLATVLAGSLLQQRIESSSRATVTSVAAVGEQLRVYLMYVLWALSGLLLSAALCWSSRRCSVG